MANYKVGDLDVTISGVSKDAVSSLDQVIKQLDTLHGKLGVVSKGFNGAFKVNVNNAAVRATTQGFVEIERVTQSATDSIETFTSTVVNGTAESVQQIQEIVNSAENLVKTFSKFDEAKTQVSKLSSELLNIHFETGSFDESKVSKMLALTKQIEATNEAFKRLSMTEQELALYDFQQANATRKQRIQYLQLMLTREKDKNKIAEYRAELRKLLKEQGQVDKAAGKSSKGGLSKLIGRISRIALYRTIRRGLQMITQTFTESIQSYAMVDDNINDMMTKLTSSTKVISLSLGTTIFPILQAITPVVQQLSVGFANMANATNKSMALAQGNATYTKINTEALKDYRKQLDKTSGALFDFDKFRALSSKKDDNAIFLSTEDTRALDEAEKKFSGLYYTINSIGVLAGNIFETVRQIINAVATSPITGMVLEVTGALTGIVAGLVNVLNKSNLIKPVVNAILIALLAWGGSKVIAGIQTLYGKFGMLGVALAAVTMAIGIIGNWDNFSEGTKKAITVISGLITVLTAAAIAALALNGALTFGTGVALATTAIAAGAVMIKGLTSIPKYAMGASDIDSGSLFIAGEAGKTEMVYTGDNGKTNVANVQQMAQAVYQGTYQATMDWWKNAKNEVGGDVYLDGEKIYQSVSRTASKHGKKFANV